MRDRANSYFSSRPPRNAAEFIFWIWAAQYAIGRLVLGFLRANPQFEPTYAFGLRQDQLIGLLVIAAAIPMLVRLGMRSWAKGGPRGAESPGPA